MTKQTKLHPADRIAQILDAALVVASKVGYARLTREDIAKRADVPASLISYHLGTMPALRRKIMREAIRTECLPVVAQGLAIRDRFALKAPEALRQAAIQSLRG